MKIIIGTIGIWAIGTGIACALLADTKWAYVPELENVYLEFKKDIVQLNLVNGDIPFGTMALTDDAWIKPDTGVVALVQRQLDAYNAGDVAGFLATYAADAELYEFPSKLHAKGASAIRKIYGDMFERLPDLHCEITQRIVQGNTVIDKERITGMGPKVVEAVLIYTIEDNKIQKAYLIR